LYQKNQKKRKIRLRTRERERERENGASFTRRGHAFGEKQDKILAGWNERCNCNRSIAIDENAWNAWNDGECESATQIGNQFYKKEKKKKENTKKKGR